MADRLQGSLRLIRSGLMVMLFLASLESNQNGRSVTEALSLGWRSIPTPTPLPCPVQSPYHFSSGEVFQFDLDEPVRPAAAHADKNLAVRGYSPVMDPAANQVWVDYGTDDPNQPPQLATLFDPLRLPAFSQQYRVHQWVWDESPNPGRRGSPEVLPPVTAVGLQVTPGESLQVPVSGYDLGGGMEVLVVFADEDTVTLRFTREDSAGSRGYTLHVDQICTDPNLLALYRRLDQADGPRYRFVPSEQRPYSYHLPNLATGQVFGMAPSSEIVVAIADSGTFVDPRSCAEWWLLRPEGSDPCP